MDHTSVVDTSLDLNIYPLRALDEAPKQKVRSNFFEFELGRKVAVRDETESLAEKLTRVTEENQKLAEMLTVMCENYNALRNQLAEYMNKNPETESTNNNNNNIINVPRKRKLAAANTSNNNVNNGFHNDASNGNSESSSSDGDSCKKPKEEHVKTKIARVCVRTEASDTSLIVKDGYQWRKYGQKVTRDNPSPRAYFKCSFAPTCPVKKKVQRSVEDQSVLVATYEGEHNHPQASRLEATSGSNRSVTLGTVPCSTTLSTSGGPTITLDLTKPKSSNHDSNVPSRRVESPEFQQFLVEQMASSLTKDPGFKAALAAAISGRMIQHNHAEKW